MKQSKLKQISQYSNSSARKQTTLFVGLHGQWNDCKESGPVLRKGIFKYPHFGDSTFEGDLLNGRRFGQGIQVRSTPIRTHFVYVEILVSEFP